MTLPQPTADSTIVVTGASSGIGTEIACGLARRGYSLVLVARRRERLDDLAAELREKHSVAVHVASVDLSDTAARAQLINRLAGDTIIGLVNSAGFGTSGNFWKLPLERESAEVNLNALALMELTHAVLPGMVERGNGAVVNIASQAGFQPMPGMAVYSATKAFVQTFSQAIHEELRGTSVSCSVICPGPVPTEWGQVADAPHYTGGIAEVPTETVAEAAIKAMLNGKRMVVPGLVAKIQAFGGRYTPRSLLLPALTKTRP